MNTKKKYIGFLLLFIGLTLLPCSVKADTGAGELQLLYGNKWIPDRDAFVFMILGDGFTDREQDYFYQAAKKTAEAIMETEPFKSRQDIFKCYGLGLVSAESGAVGDAAENAKEAAKDRRDTFFGSYFYSGGTDRLLSIDKEQEEKAELIAGQYVKDYDFIILLVNSERYGGSGGDICVASLHEDSTEIILHELGHTIAGLGDEYWPGAEEICRAKNVSDTDDKKALPWGDLLTEEGVGIYPYEDGEAGWYKPSTSCKMQYLGKEYDFCPVCQRALNEAFDAHADTGRIAVYEKISYLAIPAAALLLILLALAIRSVRENKSKLT